MEPRTVAAIVAPTKEDDVVEIGTFVTAAAVWSVLRFVRCGSCGLPVGIAEALVRVLTSSDGCSLCRRREPRGDAASLPARFTSTPELQRRGEQIRSGLQAMVARQARELAEANAALRVAHRPTSR